MALNLSQPWPDLPWVVIDCETTGPKPKTAHAVQVAAVRFERGQVVGKYVALVQPPESIPPDATAIHGITDAMVAGALPLEAHAGELVRLAQGALPVAYNAQYDRTVLHRTFEGTDCPAFDHGQAWVCPLIILRDVERVIEGKGYYKLENAARRWGAAFDKAHDAGADAEATGALLWALHEKGKVKPCPAAKLLAHIHRRGHAQEAYRTW